MPVSGFKATMIFSEGVSGFTESLYNATAADFPSMRLASMALVKLRIKLCGFGVAFVGCRISQAGARRRTSVFTAADLPGINPVAGTVPTSTGGTEDNAADVVKTAIQARMESPGFNVKQTYVCGILDAGVITDPDLGGFALIPSFKVNWDAWVAGLLSGKWGYKTLVAEAGNFVRFPVKQYLVDAITGVVSAVVAGGVPAGYAAGLTVAIHGNTRLNSAYRSVNGQHVMGTPFASGGDTAIPLGLGSVGVDITKFVKLGTVQLIDYTVANIATVTALKQTSRKRGNRFLLPVARRTVRPRI